MTDSMIYEHVNVAWRENSLKYEILSQIRICIASERDLEL